MISYGRPRIVSSTATSKAHATKRTTALIAGLLLRNNELQEELSGAVAQTEILPRECWGRVLLGTSAGGTIVSSMHAIVRLLQARAEAL